MRSNESTILEAVGLESNNSNVAENSVEFFADQASSVSGPILPPPQTPHHYPVMRPAASVGATHSSSTVNPAHSAYVTAATSAVSHSNKRRASETL